MPANCDVVPVTLDLSGGATVTIDGSTLTPSPFISMQLEKYKAETTIIGGLLRITLSGTIVSDSFNNTTAEVINILSTAQKSDCINVVIQCSNTFINGWGRITDVSFDQGNQPSWVNIIPYTATIELYENDNNLIVVPDTISNITPCLLYDMSESFNLSVNEDSFNWGIPAGSSGIYVGNRHAKVSFSISAAGLNGACSTDWESGLQAAENVILPRIDALKELNFESLNTLNSNASGLITDLNNYRNGPSYLEFRSIDVNTLANRITVNGDIIYRPSGCDWPDVFTELTVEESLDADGNQITIQGNIIGLVNTSYTSLISNTDYSNCSYNTKIASAESFLDTIKDPDTLKGIANAHYSGPYLADECATSGNVCPSGSPEPSPELCELRITNSQISKNYHQGQINFSFTLSNKQNCSIIGAKRVDVDITHDIPHDNVVEIVIPGRGDSGPITQNICCKSSEKYTISINAVLNTSRCNFKDLASMSGIASCASGLLSDIETEKGIGCWFIIDNQEQTGNNTYKLSKTYLKPSCVT